MRRADAMEVAIDALADYDVGLRDFTARRAELDRVIDKATAVGAEDVAALGARLIGVVALLEVGERREAGITFAWAVKWVG